jgi:hypothetical protein
MGGAIADAFASTAWRRRIRIDVQTKWCLLEGRGLKYTLTVSALIDGSLELPLKRTGFLRPWMNVRRLKSLIWIMPIEDAILGHAVQGGSFFIT